jgi:hypothetical protein
MSKSKLAKQADAFFDGLQVMVLLQNDTPVAVVMLDGVSDIPGTCQDILESRLEALRAASAMLEISEEAERLPTLRYSVLTLLQLAR